METGRQRFPVLCNTPTLVLMISYFFYCQNMICTFEIDFSKIWIPWQLKLTQMTPIRGKTILGLEKGQSFSVSRTFTEGDMQAFAGITRDYNPVHLDDRFAHAKGFDGRICHGLLAAGIITEIGGQIGWLASGMNFDFKKPVYFGDTITCHFTITEVDARGRAKAEAIYVNQDGITVIEAFISGILPNENERNILSQMEAEGDPTNGVMRDEQRKD